MKGNPKVKNNSYLRIGDQALWDQNFYKLYKDNKEEHHFNLMLEINEDWIDEVDPDGDNESDRSKRNFVKLFTAQDKKNRYRTFAFASMKINNDNGTIKYGTFDLNIFKPPVNLRKRLAKD